MTIGARITKNGLVKILWRAWALFDIGSIGNCSCGL